MRHVGRLSITAMLLAGACGGERPGGGEAGRAGEGGMEGMAMPSMKMPSMDLLPAVRAYLDSLVSAEPAELARFVAPHRARMEQMLTTMDQDMKAMSMNVDPAWQALADSVRTDLTAIPGLRGEQLLLRMRTHAGRLRRLLERHESMMRMKGDTP